MKGGWFVIQSLEVLLVILGRGAWLHGYLTFLGHEAKSVNYYWLWSLVSWLLWLTSLGGQRLENNISDGLAGNLYVLRAIIYSDGTVRTGMFVCRLLNVPASSKCIARTDLLKQFYVLPHWDRSYRSNSPSHPVTVYWHRADQSQHWPDNARRLAG